MAGRLPSSGAISISDLNANIGMSTTRTTTMNENHIRAFCGGRADSSQISLGDARGRGVTFTGTLARSGFARNVTLPTVALSTYFDTEQLTNSFPLYTTMNVDVPPTVWASTDNPRNMTSVLGTDNSRTGGGTGGAKNFYSVQNYVSSSQSITGSGYYSGSDTGSPDGQVTLQYISLIATGSGTGS
jgi:hypothetical protein